MENEGIIKKIKDKKFFSCHSRYISMLGGVILLLASIIIIIFSVQYFQMMKVYGEGLELIDLNQSSLTPNDIRALSYERLLENNYPLPVHHISKIIDGPILVYEGTVVSKNTSNKLVPLSKLTSGETVKLEQHQVPNQDIFFSSLEGNSSDGTSFGADSLNYSGRYISLNFGNIEKIPESNQITFNFHIRGEKDTYRLTLVNGDTYLNGWFNKTYYQNIPQGSSRLIDLMEMASSVGDEFLYLDKIQINIKKGTLINLLTFRIDLAKTTINTPGVINGNISHLVNGLVFNDKIISTNYYYFFQDWSLKQVLNQQFEIDSSDDQIIESNGWKINQMEDFKDNRTGKTIINMESERNVDLKQLSIFEIFQHFNIYNSVMTIGSPKDILFIAVFILIVLFFYPKSNGIGRKRINKNGKYKH